jgi:histidinol-phosphate aminotransferase
MGERGLCYNSSAMDTKRFVKKNIRVLSAYEAKEIPCKVKLDANESPYGFRDGIQALRRIETNRYPDPEAKDLKRIIARDLGIRQGTILHGNGSDELIYYLITVFGGPVLFPVPTFSMYGIISQALGEKKIQIPLDTEFDLDIDSICTMMRKERPNLIFLSSPNNPTGNCFSADRILKIINVARGIVVIDEAYQPFASQKGFIPLLRDYKNLLIMRTLSKVGLAGLRVGFLIGDDEIINEVNKVRLPFNLNAVSQAVSIDTLKNKKRLRSHIKSIVSERDNLFKEMKKIGEINPYPSEANFILFSVQEPDMIYKGLIKRGVLIRNMNSVIRGCLRVTVGTPHENRTFLNALKSVLMA